LTKSELIEQVSELLKLPTGKAEQLVNRIFDSMVTALQEGDGIEIRGFGSFTVREYRAYEGRNPRTGETVHVAPKRLPFFKVGKDLRDRVNRAAGTGGLDESPDDDDDVVDLDELDESDGVGDDHGDGNGHSRANGGWNGGERATERRASGEGRNFGRAPDRGSSDAG
ncbi:MAG TPA: HU family DNA-binding protein, partial [Haliangium sp.]|nr:HU family DNA-binding protein [Haliangium sp.]